ERPGPGAGGLGRCGGSRWEAGRPAPPRPTPRLHRPGGRLAAPAARAGPAPAGGGGGLAGPRPEPGGGRAARVAHDEALAAFLESVGIRAFVDRWEALPLFATPRRLPRRVWQRQRRMRLLNRPAELAASLRGMGTGAQAPLWERLARLAVPTRLVVGERDAKFVALARQMAARSPQIQVVTVPGAGHTVHLEQPEAFLQAVLPFLEAHGAEAGGQGAGGEGDRALAEAGPGG